MALFYGVICLIEFVIATSLGRVILNWLDSHQMVGKAQLKVSVSWTLSSKYWGKFEWVSMRIKKYLVVWKENMSIDDNFINKTLVSSLIILTYI